MMNSNEHPNATNENDGASLSLATATDEIIEQCITNIMRDIDIYVFKKEEATNTVRSLLNAIYRKEWNQAISHFLQLYDNISRDNHKEFAISKVLGHMSKHNLQFPLGKEDNFKEFIDLFIGSDENHNDNENENENNDRQEVKEVLLLLSAINQSNTCVDVINILVRRKGKEFVVKSNFGGEDYGGEYYKNMNVLSLCLDSGNPSIDIVNRLIEVGGEELVMEKIRWGNTTLHDACGSSNPSIDIVNKLIEVGGRELVMEKDRFGKTTLHHACASSNPSIDIVNRLIEVGGRELVMEKGGGGNTTLHFLAYGSSNPSIDIVNKLIEVGGRELVMEKGKGGNTSLHWACGSSNSSIDIVNRLIEVGGKELVMEKGRDRYTALHWACGSSNPSIDIVNKLIEVGGRELVMEKVGYGRTTLHHACGSSNQSVDVIKKLIEIGGREILLLEIHNDECESCPLLLDFDFEDITEVVVKTLIEEGLRLSLGGEFGIGGLFNCCTSTDENGNTIHDHPRQIRVYEEVWNDLILPAFQNEELQALLNDQPILHAAIIAKAPSNIIQDIINHFPQSVTFQDSQGRYAIDVAMEEGVKWDDGLKLIVEQFANQQGRTMMNVASYYGVEWNDGMEEVVEANEEQIGMVDQDVTNLYPFMLAAVGDTTMSYDLITVYNLIKRRPDLVKLDSTPI